MEPTKGELKKALGRLQNGKAGGSSGILPEIKAACEKEEFLQLLLALVHIVWSERCVPKEWADATIIPIPKKGNLSDCNNWRGIALLDVVGKVVSRVIQERLQRLAELELPETQCRFRNGTQLYRHDFRHTPTAGEGKRTPSQTVSPLCGLEEGV